MKKTLIALIALATCLLPPPAAAGPGAGGSSVRDVLPADGLIASSVVAIRSQAALNAHYYLADETVLALGAKTEAVIARYRTGGRESLLLAVAYPSAEEAGRVYARFGRDFFSGSFDPKSRRFLERIETGDHAAAARAGSFLIVVLEAPDRKSCDELLRRAEEKALAQI
jgi:hypothetical protein